MDLARVGRGFRRGPKPQRPRVERDQVEIIRDANQILRGRARNAFSRPDRAERRVPIPETERLAFDQRALNPPDPARAEGNQDLAPLGKGREELLEIRAHGSHRIRCLDHGTLRQDLLVFRASSATPDPEQEKHGERGDRCGDASPCEGRAEEQRDPQSWQAREVGGPVSYENRGHEEAGYHEHGADQADALTSQRQKPGDQDRERRESVEGALLPPRCVEARRRQIDQSHEVAPEVEAPSLGVLQAHVHGRPALEPASGQQMDPRMQDGPQRRDKAVSDDLELRVPGRPAQDPVPEDEHGKCRDRGLLAEHARGRARERRDVLPPVAKEKGRGHEEDREQILAAAGPRDQAGNVAVAREKES